jgi:hypothetical protein
MDVMNLPSIFHLPTSPFMRKGRMGHAALLRSTPETVVACTRMCDFGMCFLELQAGRPQHETAETAVLLFAKHDAQDRGGLHQDV